METATRAAVPSGAAVFPREGQTLGPFPAEAAPKAKSSHHVNGKVNDASITETISPSDKAAKLQVNGTDNEASSPSAPSIERATAEIELNGQEGAQTTSRSNGDVPPQDKKDHHEPAFVVQNTNGLVAETPNPLVGNDTSVNAVSGKFDSNLAMTPIPLTDGHQERTVVEPVGNGHFDDIWSPATKLKFLLENTKDLIVCPGVYDGFSARIALSVGFDALYMTGAGTTASRLGMADLGVASRTDMKEHADMIANLDPSKMLIADMDTGYGGPITITTTVNQYIRANVAGFHIEDQLLTKRCGHLAGKKVVSQEVYLSRIKAAKAAKDKARSDIVLIARTDANQQHGYDECLTRLRAARDLGADVGLLEGFKTKDEARRAVKDLAPWPLLLNVVENGHSPLITVDEARDMGFRIIIFSFGALVPAYLAIKGAFERLKAEGVTGVHETEISPRSIFDVCGLEEAMEVDEIAGGEDFKGGV